jgi:hypothetical protein
MLFINSCKTLPPAPVTQQQISVVDVSCTEAWLKTNGSSLTSPLTINLSNDVGVIRTSIINSVDSLVYLDSLQPGRNYTINATYVAGPNSRATFKQNFRTMDTTSHSFTWQTFTFAGECLDVSIVNDTSIWIVGKFGDYNASHWNGEQWKFFKLIFFVFPGQQITSDAMETSAVHAYENGNVIICANSEITFIKNEKQILTEWIPVSGNRIWTADTNDIYVAGAIGRVGHYDGKSWTLIETGTTMQLQDIYGVKDENTGEDRVLCVASNIFTADGTLLFQIRDNKADTISTKGLPPPYFSSIWFKNSRIAYLSGNGIFKSYNFLNSTGWKAIQPPAATYYSIQIRGNEVNDIAAAGSGGEVVHFNGVTWKNYLGSELQYFYGNLYSLDIKGNTICAVGNGNINGDNAVVLIGHRN